MPPNTQTDIKAICNVNKRASIIILIDHINKLPLLRVHGAFIVIYLMHLN